MKSVRVRLTISLPKTTADAVRALARKENRSVSAQVVHMLDKGKKR